MKTYSAKPADVEKKWVMIDATGLVVGRLASIVAHAAARQAQADLHAACRLTATTSSSSTPPRWCSPAASARRRSITTTPAISAASRSAPRKSILEGKFPERIVEKAVERMLPRGPLGRVQLGNLRVYPGPDHPHAAQKPETLDVGAMNRKNTRSA